MLDHTIGTATSAGAVTRTFTMSGASIDTPTDVDIMSFSVAAGQRVGFDLDRPSGSLDSRLRLFDGSGNQLATNDDGPTPGESSSLESYIDFTFSTGGTYYIGVSGFGNSSYNPVTGGGTSNGSTGPWSLVFNQIDPDDRIAEASFAGAIDQVRTVSGQAIGDGTDVDMISFSVVSGQRVAFDIDRPSGSLDSFIRLFNGAGTVLASNDDANAPGEVASPARESYLEFTFTTGGTYYLGVSGFGNSSYNAVTGDGDTLTGSTGSYSLIMSPVDLDDQISEAFSLGAMTTSRTRTGQAIEANTDVDMMSFSVAPGQRVAFDLDRVSGSLDSFLRIFNSSGTQLASNDDAAAPGEAGSLDSYLEFTFATAGTYYVGVSNLGNSGYNPLTGTDPSTGSTGSYTLALSTIDLDDQISEAVALGAVTSTRTRSGQSIETDTDVDMMSFEVAAGQRVGFDIDRPSGSLDSRLRIFTSSGTELASNDDGAAPGEASSFESYLEFTFATGGTYYVGVSGFGNSGYDPLTGSGDTSGSMGQFTLILTQIDPDDTIAEASFVGAMTQTRTVSSQTIDNGTDVDMISFSVTAGQRISFDLDRPTGALDSFMRLFDGTGVTLAQNDDANAPGEVASPARESYLEFTFATAGTYYLGISGFGNSTYTAVTGNNDTLTGSTGSYSLTLSPPGDPDDQISEAFFLGDMTTTRNRSGQSIEISTDVDMMSFSVTAGQTIAFDIDRPAGSNLDSNLRIFDSTGTELAFNNDNSTPDETFSTESYILRTFSTAGTYYVGVSGFPNDFQYDPLTGLGDVAGSTGAYILTLSPVVNDPDDQLDEAFFVGDVSTNRSVDNQQLDVGHDVDMVVFEVWEGQTVAFDVDGNIDSILRLFASDGTELAFNDDGAAPDEEFATESYLEYTFTSTGVFYIGVSGFDNSAYDPITGADSNSGSTGSYSLHITPLDLDDQISEAIFLGDMSTTRSYDDQQLDFDDDVDMLSFSVVAGQRIAFDVDGPLDSILRIFDSSGTQLDSNDDGVAPDDPVFPGDDPTRESYLEFTFATAGTYYVGVSLWDNSFYDPVTGTGDGLGVLEDSGEFSLYLTPLDIDDQISEAFALGAMTTTRTRTGQSVEIPTDVDMMSFSVTAGQRIEFDIDRPVGSGLDSNLRIFNSAGTELAFNNDAPGPGETAGSESFLAFTFTTAGTYYVGVSGSPNDLQYSAISGEGDIPGSTGAYTLTLTPVFSDPDDQISEAFDLGAITATRSRTGQTLDIPTDVDMLRFTVAAGQRVGFDIDRPSGSLDSRLRLFDGAGTVLASNDDGPTPGESSSLESYIEFTFATGGTYYIGVSGFGNSGYDPITGSGDTSGSTGPYSLIVTQIDPDDTIAEASSVGAMTQTRTVSSQTIDNGTDVDMISFSVTAGQRISFDLDRPTGALDSFMRLFDGAGTVLAQNDDANAPGEVASPARESYLEFTFATAGTYYLGISGFGNSTYTAVTGNNDTLTGSTGSYSLILTPLGDPDDQISEAFSLGAMTIARTRSGQSIENSTDVDMMSFSVTAGQTIGFDLDRPSGSLDSYLRIFNSSGSELAFNDDGAGPGESSSLESYIQFTFSTAGTYYVGVSNLGNSDYNPLTGADPGSGSTGPYTLILTPIDLDPDDAINQANSLGSITTTTTRTGFSINPSGDVDMFSFTVTANQRLAFDIDRPAGSLDSYLRLFNASGTELTRNDDGPNPDESSSFESYLEYTFTTAGTFYLGVSGFGNSIYNPLNGTGDLSSSTGDYTLIVSPVVFDFNDQISEATSMGTLTTSLTQTGFTIDLGTDVDMFSFSVQAGQRVSIDVDRPSGDLDSFLRLFNASGTELAFNDDGSTPSEAFSRESYLEYTFSTAGTYYFGVSSYNNRSYGAVSGNGDISGSTLGDYSVIVTTLGADTDPNDQLSEATVIGAINSSVTQTGFTIDQGTDVDMFRFTVTAGQRIAFDIDRPSGSLDSYIRVFNSTGTQLAANDDGPHPGESPSLESYLEHTFSAAGTYYVGVSGYLNSAYNAVTGGNDSSGSTGDYTLTLAPVAAPPTSGFQIQVNLTGFTPSQIAIFTQAADRWEQIIVGDLPDAVFNGQTVDDLLIDGSSVNIDGPGGVLGQANATHLRVGSSLPYRGFMQFDTADVANMEANGRLLAVILHEMGHVLGIGTIWAARGLISGSGTANPVFTGAQAVAEYNALFGLSATSVPVENTGGPGTANAHWRESVFTNELMTGWISGTTQPLSRMTAASLADCGYTVNLNAADSFTPSVQAALTSLTVGAGSSSLTGFALREAPVIGSVSRTENGTSTTADQLAGGTAGFTASLLVSGVASSDTASRLVPPAHSAGAEADGTNGVRRTAVSQSASNPVDATLDTSSLDQIFAGWTQEEN